MDQNRNTPGGEAEARREVLAAITRQARAVGDQAAPDHGRLLEHLARAVAVLTGAEGPGPKTTADPDSQGRLQMLTPTGQERAGGHKVGLALELEQ
ncbi:hypothetical protein [Streptomyces mexicanus]|uniref:hypothetical protein n=1 Tax=Streptomyces mexicanus TaxID=178566 RepID=UPI0036555B90